jgi:hypothetical protein
MRQSIGGYNKLNSLLTPRSPNSQQNSRHSHQPGVIEERPTRPASRAGAGINSEDQYQVKIRPVFKLKINSTT